MNNTFHRPPFVLRKLVSYPTLLPGHFQYELINKTIKEIKLIRSSSFYYISGTTRLINKQILYRIIFENVISSKKDDARRATMRAVNENWRKLWRNEGREDNNFGSPFVLPVPEEKFNVSRFFLKFRIVSRVP